MRRWVLPLSMILHSVAVAALWPWQDSGQVPRNAPPIEVELIQQPDTTPGVQPNPPADTAPTAPALPPPDKGEGPVATPAPSRAPSNPPAVHLGDNDRWLDGLIVTARDIKPPAPDAAYRNLPPRYPADAARRGAEGTVGLVIHVSARGTPDSVLVGSSSGDGSLDRAARAAVQAWRFTPAIEGDRAVPFDYALDIRFVLGSAR